MRPVEPAELSALLDGELSPDRADQVRQALATDPTLRRQFERLAALDVRWRSAAELAAFRPHVTAPARSRAGVLVGTALALVTLRLVLKLLPPGIAIGLELLALIGGAGWVLGRVLCAVDADLSQVKASRAASAAGQ